MDGGDASSASAFVMAAWRAEKLKCSEVWEERLYLGAVIS